MTPDRFSDEFVIEAAKDCKSLAQLQRRVQWPDFQALRARAKRLGLNLPIIKVGRSGAPKEAQACPKPVGKGAKPAAKKPGGDE